MMNKRTIGITYLDYGAAEKQAILEIVESGMFIQGKEVRALEEAFAAYLGVKHAIAVNSGTAALHLALLAAGVQAGDEVIVPSWTFFATTSAVLQEGAVPVYVDIDPLTFNLDPVQIERAITVKTRAIMPVHLYGLPANMGPIMEIANRYRLAVVEDACQAHGAKHQGVYAGRLGHLAAFSFYPSKNVPAAGEGGMVTTDDDDLAEDVRMRRQHGMNQQYFHELRGFNYRLPEMAAVFARIQLEKLPERLDSRTQNAAFLNRLLRKLVSTPILPDGDVHAWHQYTIREVTGQRDALLNHLQKNGIFARVYYPTLCSDQPAMARCKHRLVGDLFYSRQAAEQVISLPIHHGLTEEDLAYMVDAITSFYW